MMASTQSIAAVRSFLERERAAGREPDPRSWAALEMAEGLAAGTIEPDPNEIELAWNEAAQAKIQTGGGSVAAAYDVQNDRRYGKTAETAGRDTTADYVAMSARDTGARIAALLVDREAGDSGPLIAALIALYEEFAANPQASL